MKMWRFPDNGYGPESGYDTGDVETFKKDPIASLAREICQNSIDAANSEKPVRVEFRVFYINRTELPGIDELTKQINNCYNYKKDSIKEGTALKSLKNNIESSKITCLRISDFNTTGAWGADSDETTTPFYLLTKGSGVSEKNGSSGGSKGIGKFASFVVSTTNTVFYSTKAKAENGDSCGYIGISKLRSAPVPGKPRLLTMGIGYYGESDMNDPILKELHLDKNFSRQKHEYGTDVFIIGFNTLKGWENNIIAKILESFMVAIMRGRLEVNVSGTEINAGTIKQIIEDSSFQSTIRKTDLKEIRAQYELLKLDDSVLQKNIDVNGSEVVVYVKRYGRDNISDATKHCAVVRYPYMKITNLRTGINIAFSALCIIEDNELNRMLRDIENPQHTDWEIKRLDDYPDKKKETRALKKALEEKVKNCISEFLCDGGDETTDLDGAGEFLPSQDETGENTDGIVNTEYAVINRVMQVKAQMPKTEKLGEDGESYDFTQGEIADDGQEGKKLNENESFPNPNPTPIPEPEDNETKIGSGQESFLIKTPLSGMRYINISTNKNKGEYDCIFTSKYNEQDCELFVRMCGDDTKKFPVEIISASVNGQKCSVEDGKIVHLKIEEGKKYIISYSVDVREMFSSEVILNACR